MRPPPDRRGRSSSVPTVTFQPIPPPEEEPPPEAPTMAGATGVEGRYGVVAGERRTVVWSFTVDPRTYPSAEPLERPSPAASATARAGGSPAAVTEVLGRVVVAADAAGAEGATLGTGVPPRRLGGAGGGGRPGPGGRRRGRLDRPRAPRETRRRGLLLDELDEGAEAALGVHEGHGRAAAAGAGRLVDGRGARRDHRREGRRAVVDAVADVVQPLAALLDRLGDRRVRAAWPR